MPTKDESQATLRAALAAAERGLFASIDTAVCAGCITPISRTGPNGAWSHDNPEIARGYGCRGARPRTSAPIGRDLL